MATPSARPVDSQDPLCVLSYVEVVLTDGLAPRHAHSLSVPLCLLVDEPVSRYSCRVMQAHL